MTPKCTAGKPLHAGSQAGLSAPGDPPAAYPACMHARLYTRQPANAQNCSQNSEGVCVVSVAHGQPQCQFALIVGLFRHLRLLVFVNCNNACSALQAVASQQRRRSTQWPAAPGLIGGQRGELGRHAGRIISDVPGQRRPLRLLRQQRLEHARHAREAPHLRGRVHSRIRHWSLWHGPTTSNTSSPAQPLV